jgi:transposase-like protein
MTPSTVRQLLRTKKLSHAAAAQAMGISRSTLFRWLRDPSTATLAANQAIIAWAQANGGLSMRDQEAWEALDKALLALVPNPAGRRMVTDLVTSLAEK